MPEAFLKCMSMPGSKKVTKSLSGGHYIRGCKPPGSNKFIWGERKKSKSGSTIIKGK